MTNKELKRLRVAEHNKRYEEHSKRCKERAKPTEVRINKSAINLLIMLEAMGVSQ